MALTSINDSQDLQAPKALDKRIGKVVGGMTVPFTNSAEAIASMEYRHPGMTFLVGTGEYWFVGGIEDVNFVNKITSPGDVPPPTPSDETFIIL